MLYDVTAIGVDSLTGTVVAGPRTERIDSETNEVFQGCNGPWEIEDQYEAYWNRLNDSWEDQFPAGQPKVKVVRVERVTVPALN